MVWRARLAALVAAGLLVARGEKRGRFYEAAESLKAMRAQMNLPRVQTDPFSGEQVREEPDRYRVPYRRRLLPGQPIVASQHARYLLTPTLVTCPKCEHEFPLAEGFAKKALESVEEASSDALAKLREEERTAVERQAAIARERDVAHENALAQVRTLAEQSVEAAARWTT
jgi:hypothetical protein